MLEYKSSRKEKAKKKLGQKMRKTAAAFFFSISRHSKYSQTSIISFYELNN